MNPRPNLVAGLALWATVALLAIVGAANALPHRGTVTVHSAPRVCFPASSWDAPNKRRPCVRVVRLYEDGSLRLRVSDAGGRLRYVTGVPNLED